jgi:hypothetical protein
MIAMFRGKRRVMISHWERERDPEQNSWHHFRNLDYGKFGPTDIIRISTTLRLNLSECSQITFRSLRADGGTHSRVLITRGSREGQTECWLISHDHAEKLLDDIVSRGKLEIN